eukprot:Gb_25923 [translate_table: standard]
MRRIFGSKKEKAPPPSVEEASEKMNRRGDVINEKIKKLDVELCRYKDQIKKTRAGPSLDAIKARAMRVLKQKKMYVFALFTCSIYASHGCKLFQMVTRDQFPTVQLSWATCACVWVANSIESFHLHTQHRLGIKAALARSCGREQGNNDLQVIRSRGIANPSFKNSTSKNYARVLLLTSSLLLVPIRAQSFPRGTDPDGPQQKSSVYRGLTPTGRLNDDSWFPLCLVCVLLSGCGHQSHHGMIHCLDHDGATWRFATCKPNDVAPRNVFNDSHESQLSMIVGQPCSFLLSLINVALPFVGLLHPSSMSVILVGVLSIDHHLALSVVDAGLLLCCVQFSCWCRFASFHFGVGLLCR